MKLLTCSNPKTAKGIGKGYLSFILHLAPSNLSGYNVCPAATKGCRSACLNTAGRGGMIAGSANYNGAELVQKIRAGEVTNIVQAARIRKTKMFYEMRNDFFNQLVREITNGISLANKHNLIPCIRLNGTSDISWERIVGQNGKTLFDLFPNVQFYDYTKIAGRTVPANYHLTFSRSEHNDLDCWKALRNGRNVAMVFSGKLPSSWWGYEVVNGDETDLRFLDKSPVIVGLKAKGKGKKDISGFVTYA